MSSLRNSEILCLFDVDGTVTPPRQKIALAMENCLQELRNHCKVGLVGGSDVSKILEQLGGASALNKYDYIFSENGLVSYKNGNLFHTQTINSYLHEDLLQKFINTCLLKLSEITLPFKRGTFIEFRKGMINISPVGRNCTQPERDEFEAYDKIHGVRSKLIESLKKEFPNLKLKYSIGGQISFDVFPEGWDKTYTLKLLQEEGFNKIYFFGDKVDQGGNDYEIYSDPRTIGHAVKNPDDTVQVLKTLFTDIAV